MRIKIVQRPEGEAPEEVRDGWIGVEMPCLYKSPPGVSPATEATYTVSVYTALRALCQNGEAGARAYEWWTTIPSSYAELYRQIAEEERPTGDLRLSDPVISFNASACDEMPESTDPPKVADREIRFFPGLRRAWRTRTGEEE